MCPADSIDGDCVGDCCAGAVKLQRARGHGGGVGDPECDRTHRAVWAGAEDRLDWALGAECERVGGWAGADPWIGGAVEVRGKLGAVVSAKGLESMDVVGTGALAAGGKGLAMKKAGEALSQMTGGLISTVPTNAQEAKQMGMDLVTKMAGEELSRQTERPHQTGADERTGGPADGDGPGDEEGGQGAVSA